MFWALRPQPSLAAGVIGHIEHESGSWSAVAPMNTRPPAVVIGPALLLLPVFCLPSGRVSVMPRVDCQTISPVLPLTAVRRPHGGFWQGQLPTTLPVASLPGALNPA